MPMVKELIERHSMSQSALDRLVKMVNQIALNMSANGTDTVVADQVAQHLQKFWSPAMRDLLVQRCEDADIGLSPIAKLAIYNLLIMQDSKRSPTI